MEKMNAYSLLTVTILAVAYSVKGQAFQECQALTDHYLEKHHKEAAPYTGSNLLYFLHVPRTAGRTFHSCLLKMGIHPARRCPKAYDHLRLTNMSMPNCYLLSSHDDFSVVSMLPADAAVLTQLRDPVDRFLSAYEFATEVAARTLRRPRNASGRKKIGRIATEDVWPWSYLVPFFAEDMRPKVAAAQQQPIPPGGRWVEIEGEGDRWFYNKVLNESRWELTEDEKVASGGVAPALDPYDNELVISLKDFAKHPIAQELLHNGAAFQVLGITNYSHWGDAGSFRSCLHQHAPLRAQMLAVAEARVKRFAHVGTTDRLFESASSALVAMGLSVNSAAYSGGDDDVVGRGGVRQRVSRSPNPQTLRTAAGRLGSGAGARLQLLAKLIREARQRLQAAQMELAEAQRKRSDPDVLEMLRGRVDAARFELIDAQEKLADEREQLPANLGGGAGRMNMQNTADPVVDLAQGARRRLMSVEETETTDAGQVAAEETAVSSEEDGGAEQRRLLGFNKVRVPDTDAYGNPLDLQFRKIPNTDVGTEFVRCATRAQQRSSSRREQSLSALSYPDGRMVVFSKAARKRIPQEVLDLIRSYNTLDTSLHRLGLSLLDQHVAEQKAANLYRDVPARAADSIQTDKTSSRLIKPLGERASSGDELR